MKNTLLFLFTAITALALVQCGNDNSQSKDAPKEISAETATIDFLGDVTIHDAVKHKNLEIFLITGDAKANNIEYVSLNRAMEKKWVKVSETSEVNELEISNLSDHTVFIHAGDIVKGGKQDRTLTYDVIVSAGTKNMKISSFCVESNRWSQRGSEEAGSFSSNTKMLSSRDLKISSKKDNEQSAVWGEVAETQQKLNDNVGAYYNKNVDVKANASGSSLELTLENKELKKLKKEYKAQFKNLDLENAIGFAYAINGELYNVDIYNNELLFQELYEKLLSAAIIEAIAELDVKAKKHSNLPLKELVSQLNLKEDFDETEESINKRTRWITKEDEFLIVFTSIDHKNYDKWVHHNVIVKDDSEPKEVKKNQVDEMLVN